MKLSNTAVEAREIPMGTDLNSIVTEGWYLCPNDAVALTLQNTPEDAIFAFTMLVTKAPNVLAGSDDEVTMIHRTIFIMNNEVDDDSSLGGKKPLVYYGTYNATTEQASDWIQLGAFQSSFNPANGNLRLKFGAEVNNIDLSSLKPSAMGGLSLLKLSKAQFDALETKDPDTIYYVTDENKIIQYMGETKLQSGSVTGNVIPVLTVMGRSFNTHVSEPEDVEEVE
ncbi:MAG: pyocin knob domain-containing protein [Bacteroidaceae bacterium]|nr:pyocin knob domain-containing protein [Bacteroidaceae bacterium]